MKPLLHAKISAKKHGGQYSDYLDIHSWFDQTKAHVADMRHRAILHNSFGIYLCSQVFGEVRTNSDGKEYSVRDVAEDHVIEDIGIIPPLTQVIEAINIDHLQWLGGPTRKSHKVLSFDDLNKMEEIETLHGSAESFKLKQEVETLKRKLGKLLARKE